MYDLMHHSSSPVELTVAYDVNYNTIRYMYNLYIKLIGETYKHQRMYTDINNPVLRVAIRADEVLAAKLLGQATDAELAEQSGEPFKVCNIYLYNDWSLEDARMKLFSVDSEQAKQ